MLYYLGKGTEFKKEECKEYKTSKNALAAAAKDETLTVWDEKGAVIRGLTNDTTEEEILERMPDNEDVAEMSLNVPETAENGGEEDGTENEQDEPENGEHEANTRAETGEDDEGQQDSVIIPQGTMKVTVVCDGALNLRRSLAWGNENICGRAVRGQSYYVKEIHTIDGKKMVRTIDGICLSGEPEHVRIEKA